MTLDTRTIMFLTLGLLVLLALVMPDVALAADAEDYLDNAFGAWVDLLTGKWVVGAFTLVVIGAGLTTYMGILPLRTLALGTLGMMLILGSGTLGSYLYDKFA